MGERRTGSGEKGREFIKTTSYSRLSTIQLMYKLTAFFTKPESIEAFDAHYDSVHAPLMRAVPGLQSLVVSRNLRSFGADSPYYLIAEMTFADRDTFKAAMATEENKAAGKDLMSFAAGLVTMVHGEAQEV